MSCISNNQQCNAVYLPNMRIMCVFLGNNDPLGLGSCVRKVGTHSSTLTAAAIYCHLVAIGETTEQDPHD